MAQRESQLHELVRQVEAAALEHSLQAEQLQVQRPSCCGHAMNKQRLMSRQLLTPVGLIAWGRGVYRGPRCGRYIVPLDDLLGIPRRQFSPRLANLGMDIVQVESFGQAAEQLKRQHGVSVSSRTLVDLAGQIGFVARAFATDHVPDDWLSETHRSPVCWLRWRHDLYQRERRRWLPDVA